MGSGCGPAGLRRLGSQFKILGTRRDAGATREGSRHSAGSCVNRFPSRDPTVSGDSDLCSCAEPAGPPPGPWRRGTWGRLSTWSDGAGEPTQVNEHRALKPGAVGCRSPRSRDPLQPGASSSLSLSVPTTEFCLLSPTC